MKKVLNKNLLNALFLIALMVQSSTERQGPYTFSVLTQVWMFRCGVTFLFMVASSGVFIGLTELYQEDSES